MHRVTKGHSAAVWGRQSCVHRGAGATGAAATTCCCSHALGFECPDAFNVRICPPSDAGGATNFCAADRGHAALALGSNLAILSASTN